MSASKPGPATKPCRISRPCAVRIGTFCRLGLSLESRPVAATICLKVVWMRPSSATVGSSCFSTTMSSRVISRWCSSRSITGWVPSRFCRASASVVQPVLIFLVLGRPSSSNSSACSCLGLPRWNSCPTLSYAASAAALTRSRRRVSSADEVVDVGGDAGALAVGEHPHQRQLEVAQQRGAAAPLEVLVERDREVGDRAGVQDRVGGGRVVLGLLAAVEGQLRRPPAAATSARSSRRR